MLCLEGEWGSKLTDRTTVEHHLRMFEADGVSLIHRDVATLGELNHYMSRWTQKQYAEYRLLYLGFHGNDGCLSVGGKWVSLDEVADCIDGRAAGRIIYFGSCRTLGAPDAVLSEFCRRTKALAVAGYTKEVDWKESAAFDLLLLSELLYAKEPKFAYQRLTRKYDKFTHGLGFRMITKDWVSPRPRRSYKAASSESKT
jgi:hypothetical protein